MCVEVLTPDGNWSSYPPHKHDDSPECPVNNEEIYYFRIGRRLDGLRTEGFGLHRTYTGDGRSTRTSTVRDGDVFLVPARLPRAVRGRARLPDVLPERDGRTPGSDRVAFVDDPPYHWIRSTWDGMDLDPRLPHDLGKRPRGEVRCGPSGSQRRRRSCAT